MAGDVVAALPGVEGTVIPSTPDRYAQVDRERT